MKSLSETVSLPLLQFSSVFQLSAAIKVLISFSLSLLLLSSALPECICFSNPAPDWAPISGNQYNMIAFGHLHIDGVEPGKGMLTLYSFGPKGDRDCRSKGNIGADGAYYATIRGNARGEIISFKVYDWNKGKVYGLKDTMTFEIDAVKENFDLR